MKINRNRIASLVLLGVFISGCTSSGVISAQSIDNLTSMVESAVDDHGKSVDTSDEVNADVLSVPSKANDDINIDEKTSDSVGEETILENSNGSLGDLAQASDESAKDSTENKDYVFIGGAEKNKKSNNIKKALGIAGVVVGVSGTVGGTVALGKKAFSSKLKNEQEKKGSQEKGEKKTQGEEKKDQGEKIKESPEEYKESSSALKTWLLIGLSPIAIYLITVIIVAIIDKAKRYKALKGNPKAELEYSSIRPLFGLFSEEKNESSAVGVTTFSIFISNLALSSNKYKAVEKGKTGERQKIVTSTKLV